MKFFKENDGLTAHFETHPWKTHSSSKASSGLSMTSYNYSKLRIFETKICQQSSETTVRYTLKRLNEYAEIIPISSLGSEHS